MSNSSESHGLRDSSVGESTGSWDPYEVWLNRVKKPRDGVSAGAAQPAVPPPTVPVIKVVAADLSETARLRTITQTAG